MSCMYGCIWLAVKCRYLLTGLFEKRSPLLKWRTNWSVRMTESQIAYVCVTDNHDAATVGGGFFRRVAFQNNNRVSFSLSAPPTPSPCLQMSRESPPIRCRFPCVSLKIVVSHVKRGKDKKINNNNNGVFVRVSRLRVRLLWSSSLPVYV